MGAPAGQAGAATAATMGSTSTITPGNPVGNSGPNGASYDSSGNLIPTQNAPAFPSSTSAPAPAPVAIVTSGQSRSNYANNVNTLQTAQNGIAANTNNTNGTDPSIVDYLNVNGQPSDYASRAAMAAKMGIQNYTGTAAQNTQMLASLRAGSSNSSGSSNGTSAAGTGTDAAGSTTTTDNSSTTGTGVTAVSTIMNGDGSSTITNSDGSTTIKNADGSSYNLPAGMDPSIGKQLHDNEVQANADVASAKTTMDQATALLASDQNGTNPAAIAAANSIKNQFGVLIQQMQAKNAIIAGGAKTSAIRGGSLQYGNDMAEGAINDEVQQGVQRIADLTNQMNDAIMKSNMAYQSGDVAALNAATTDYKNSFASAQKSLLDLNTAVNDQVKQNAADIKTAQQAVKDQQTSDISNAKALAPDFLSKMTAAGITDPSDPKFTSALQSYATANGITNPSYLLSAYNTEAQNNQKTAFSQNNEATNTSLSEARLGIEQQNASQGGASKPLTPSEISTLTKSNPLVSLSYGDTSQDAQTAVANATGVTKAIATDFADPANVGPQGYLSYDYIKNTVLPNLPVGVDPVALMTHLYNQKMITPKLTSGDNYKNYGLTLAQANTIMGK